MNKKEILRDMAISEIFLLVAEQNALAALRKKVSLICQKYFPNADKVFVDTMMDFAFSVQHFYYSNKCIHIEINRYEKEKCKNQCI